MIIKIFHMPLKDDDLMQKIVSFCKRRGFIFPASEIYGGFANAYSYGPYGTELKNNIKKLWWKMFVQDRADIVGLDGPILLNPKIWEASGRDLEGDLKAMSKILHDEKVKCPNCGQSDWTKVRNLNLMFKTEMNGIEGPVYLRPETAGAIFVDFKNSDGSFW